jgi:oligoendopeptidase F
VTKEDMDDEYLSLLKEQFGTMHVPEVFKHEWNYIPHIHNSPFYCYSYAWGNLLVLSLYDTYRKEGKSFIDKYANMLATGGSETTSDMLKKLGINPDTEEFWERGFKIINEQIDMLKSLK